MKLSIFSFSHPLYQSMIASKNNYVNREAITTFDESGGLPQLGYTYKAIQAALPMIAIRIQNNGTLLTFATMNVSRLVIPSGCEPLSTLVNPWQHIYLTGIAGDCRIITRLAKTIVLDYTVAFTVPPPSLYIVRELSKVLQDATLSGGMRPYACHLFIIDAINKELYEVDAAGTISRIFGGVAGRMMSVGKQLLEESLNFNFSYIEGSTFSREILVKMMEGMDSDQYAINQVFIADKET